MTTRISSFYKKTPEQRLDYLANNRDLSEEEKNVIKGDTEFTINQANEMIENAIGIIPIPLGVAVNFKIDGNDTFIPMATEEASVVAAASHAAKIAYNTGGFSTSYTGSIMRGQIQVTSLKNPYEALTKVYENKNKILQICNEQDDTLVSLGGGAKDLEAYIVEGKSEDMLIIHLLVDTKDAMGANAVNTMAESVSNFIEKVIGGEVILRILSNLSDQRIVRARAVFEDPFQGNEEACNRFILAHELAIVDPYRAATHNKGIMNGISAVVLATGNDTRAVEAGAHAYAAKSGQYRSLTQWERDENNNIIGTIEMPMSVGIIGGATSSHPTASLAMKIMGIKSSQQLAGIISAVGLAQNFAAIKALIGEGIQKGHMKLHVKNTAYMAGATTEQIDKVVAQSIAEEKYRFDDIKKIIENMQ